MSKRELSYWRKAVWLCLMEAYDDSAPFLSLWYGELLDNDL